MNKNESSPENSSEFGRRDFLKATSLATLMAWMGGVELRAADTNTTSSAAVPLTPIPKPPPINVGVIGCNVRGREVIAALVQLDYPKVVAVSDTYKSALRRAAEAAGPQAEK